MKLLHTLIINFILFFNLLSIIQNGLFKLELFILTEYYFNKSIYILVIFVNNYKRYFQYLY